jgi:uncharacterized protein
LLILLPPSETKQLGGDLPQNSSFAFSELDSARAEVRAALISLCQNLSVAARALKFGNLEQLKLNLELASAPTMPAAARYTGVLYSALQVQALSERELTDLGSRVFIQSALFGLLPAMEPIPWYRLSAGSSLPGLSLKALWGRAHEGLWAKFEEPIIDLRSKAYQELAPLPASIESYQVEVLDQKSGRALNHFNKKAKGAFVRASLGAELSSMAQAEAAANRAGLGFRQDSSRLQLLVPSGF